MKIVATKLYLEDASFQDRAARLGEMKGGHPRGDGRAVSGFWG